MRVRIFRSTLILEHMLYLRLQGWALKDLSHLFGCDKTSIRKACMRSGYPTVVALLPRPIIRFIRVPIDFDGERVNPGKSYAEYLEDDRKRQQKRSLEAV